MRGKGPCSSSSTINLLTSGDERDERFVHDGADDGRLDVARVAHRC